MAKVIYRLPPGIGPRPMQRDATSVAGRGADAAERQMRMNAEAKQMPSEDEQILADRKSRSKRAQAARERTGQFPDSAENMAERSLDLEDVFRLFPNDPNSFIDDYLNPMVMIGGFASGLGQVPLNIKQGDYAKAVANVALPVLTGSLGRMAEIITPHALDAVGQKILFSDLYSDKILPKILDTKAYGVAYDLVHEPWRFNPFAYKVPEGMMVRGVGRKGVDDLMESGLVRPLDYSDLYATKNLDVAASFADDAIIHTNPLTGKKRFKPRRGEIVEFPRNVVDEDAWISKYGTDPNAEYYGKGIGWEPTWSEYTATHPGFPGVPIEKVRILEPSKLMRYRYVSKPTDPNAVSNIPTLPFASLPALMPQRNLQIPIDSATAGNE